MASKKTTTGRPRGRPRKNPALEPKATSRPRGRPRKNPASEPKPKGKNGRPTAYKSEYNDQVTKLCMLGAIEDQIADFFNVTDTTIDNWKKRYPEFLEAMKLGKMGANANVAKALYHRAIGYSHPEDKIFSGGFDGNGNPRDPVVVPSIKHYPPDTAAAFIWLKNREKELWRDKHEVDMNANITVEIVEFKLEGPKK